jgi:superfamily II DNA/RNA helicase
MASFADLGLRAPLVAALAQEGVTEPFPIQELTIRDALAGRDVCGKAKTGSGKTLAFGLPLLQRAKRATDGGRPTALVLVPTRELAGQVGAVLVPLAQAIDLRVDTFYGGTNIEKQMRSLKRGVDIAVATPGRMIDLLERRAISLDDVSAVVVDEADRMTDMGFLPQLEWILRRLGTGHCQTLLFSATLDGDVGRIVRHHLTDPVAHEVESETETVDDMLHRFLEVHHMDRVKVAAAISGGTFRTLIFVRTKRGADRLEGQLKREGVRAAAIHGDLRQTARERALADFTKGDVAALVATDVAARGIHVDDVDVVIHFDPPEDHKAYLHRSGRTARAGREGVVVTFVLWDQMVEVDRMKVRLGLDEPTVRVFSNDPRLSDLAALGHPAARESEQLA